MGLCKRWAGGLKNMYSVDWIYSQSLFEGVLLSNYVGLRAASRLVKVRPLYIVKRLRCR